MATMITNPEQHWRVTLAQWRQSGLSITAFCKRHRVNKSSFYRWKAKLDSLDSTPATPVQFIPITLTTTTLVEVQIGDVAIKIPLDATAEQITRWIQVVASC